MKKSIILLVCALFSSPLLAASEDSVLLVIGASFANGSMPFNDQLQAPLGGISVGLGSYLSLGQALTRHPALSGYVINEAQAGASTFDRDNCAPACTPGVGWQGYDKQLTKALARVSLYDAATGKTFVNAKYVVISLGNDCLHSNAFGVPENQAVPCSPKQVDEYIDRLIDVGRQAEQAGLVPIYEKLPAWNRIDLAAAQQIYGLQWMVSAADYNFMRERLWNRLNKEMPDALVLDYWAGYETLGDHFHPSPKATKRAAQRIAEAISQREAGGAQ
ncbi:MAG: SGNH/GDSL hydrolase family protein [Methylococcaceae bacterium]|nr:MAG: SGNH/GDSL hydrolase family protein [Methylococcaceae bacterium]